MTGLPIHSSSRSDAPGRSGATRAESSIVSVRPSAGYIWLGRLKRQFQFSGIGVPYVEDDFADSVFDRTLAIAAASLSLLSLSPSRQSRPQTGPSDPSPRRPLVQPAETTPGNESELRNQRRGAIRIDIDVDRLFARRAAPSHDTLRLLRETSTSWPFNPFRKSVTASSFTFTCNRFR